MLKKLICAALTLILCCSCAVTENSTGRRSLEQLDGELAVCFMDVGQGDCSVTRLPDGKIMMIDGGERENAENILDFYRENGISRIDYLIATHSHADHIGSLCDIVGGMEIGEIYMPRVQNDTKTFEALLTAVKNAGLKIKTAAAGVEMINDGKVTAHFLAPFGEAYDELNNYSAVLKLKYKNISFLFTGDAEAESEDEMLSGGADLSADVLKIGHHGSNTSSQKKFLDAVVPSVAVISSDGKSYGHPDKRALERIYKCNNKIKIYRTDINGDIYVFTDGNTIEVAKDK